MPQTKVMKISGGTPHNSAAESVIRSYDAGFSEITLRSIGMSGVNQMVKTAAVCRRLFKERKDLDVTCAPEFQIVDIGEKEGESRERTAMAMRLIFNPCEKEGAS